ncbi:MAG TPA: PepSY-like domain-containing protein [Bacteroidota bacterium]
MTSHLKPSILVLLFTVFACAYSQEQAINKTKVPRVILKAFQKSYPKATAKAFKTETESGKKYFEIESREGKISRDLLYSEDGTVIEIEESITTEQLPDSVKNAVEKDFPSGQIVKSEKTTRGSDTSYEFIIRVGKKRYEAVYSQMGNQARKEEIKSKGDNEDNEEDED